MDNNTSPPPHVRQLASELAEPKPMRRGSVSERTIKCNKPGCACAHDPKARHGPYFSLTRAVQGKTRSPLLDGAAGRPGQPADRGRTRVSDQAGSLLGRL